MKASELRIGNLVMWYDRVLPIAGIEKNKAWVETLENEQDQLHYLPVLKPIPLTEEWFEKLGLRLTRSYGIYHLFDFSENMSIKWFEGVIYIEEYSEGEMPLNHIKYVHQLQNLYFALTGEELG